MRDYTKPVKAKCPNCQRWSPIVWPSKGEPSWAKYAPVWRGVNCECPKCGKIALEQECDFEYEDKPVPPAPWVDVHADGG